MTVGSLFSGIGGLDRGLEMAGMETKWFCEIEEYPQQVLARHWPGVPIIDDVRKITAGSVSPVDVIAGGFPCQGISWAWAGGGLSDRRSGLWYEMVRICGFIRPKYIIIENVANLRSRGLAVVLSDLARIGYNASWATIPAAYVGAPHYRPRLFVTAWREWEPIVFASECSQCDQCEEPWCVSCQEHYSECACLGPHSAEDGGYRVEQEDWGIAAYPDHAGREEQRGAVTIPPQHIPDECPGWWEAQPPLLRVDDGFPGRVDRIKALGNAVVPQVGYLVGRAVMEHAKETGRL